MSINPLANPKGLKLLCELCQKPAFIQCTKCRVTYYCCREHQESDAVGIHNKICQLLVPLRTPSPFLNSEEERVKYREQILLKQKEMIELTRTVGQKLLFEGRYEQSIPAAMQSLRFSISVHGVDSIELVPSYLILGEASIGLKRLSQAEEYLSQAQWTVTKTPSCSNSIKHKLYRNLALLYAAKSQWDLALRELADDIYHASYEYGTDDIRTSGGYYHMANIFLKQNKISVADSLYEEVTKIWCTHLEKLIAQRVKEANAAPSLFGQSSKKNNDEKAGTLDEAQEAEATQVLKSIFDLRTNQSEKNADSVAAISYSLAMLHYILDDIKKAKEYGRRAVVESEHNEERSVKIVEFLKICENVY